MSFYRYRRLKYSLKLLRYVKIVVKLIMVLLVLFDFFRFVLEYWGKCMGNINVIKIYEF